MARLGHSSTRAALIYQHATRDRDQAIAMALGGLARQVGMSAAARPEEPRERHDRPRVWHVCGTTMASEPVAPTQLPGHQGRDQRISFGAGEGNRTLMTSLEGRGCHAAVQPIPRSAGMPIARE
jgi:hypothetical protein